MPGRSIRIFLIDGTTSGVRTAELGLSTIKALAIPRASLSAVTSRPELSKTGVYVLIGTDSQFPGRNKVYIGEGDVILNRLSLHNKAEDKDFWDECVLFVSKDQNLTKAHVRYVEGRLIKLASDSKRATLANSTAPDVQGWLPEADEVEMEEFISQARLLLGSLGYDIFENERTHAAIQPPSQQEQAEAVTDVAGVTPPIFKYSGNGFSAKCILELNTGQYIVTLGSIARKLEAPSMQPTYRNLREQLCKSGVLVELDTSSFTFTQNYGFRSPSAAAQVVGGTNINGRAAWRTDNGQTLADWQNSQLSNAEN